MNKNFRLYALLKTGGKTGYTDTTVRVVSPVEGRFQRWGKWEEYDTWLTGTAPRALRIGRSPAAQSMAVGETISVPVDVHNWSGVRSSREPSSSRCRPTSRPTRPPSRTARSRPVRTRPSSSS